MSDIREWSPVAINNSDPSPDGYPEGMAPGGVNDSDRETMASVRRKWEDADWFDWGHVITYISATQFSIPGDVSAIYHVDRRVRAVMPVAGTIYGRVTAVEFTTNTAVTVLWDAGGLALEVGIQMSVGIQIANAASTSLPMYWIQNEFGLLNPDILCYQDKNAVDIDGGNIAQDVVYASLPNLAGGSSAVAAPELEVLVGIDTTRNLEERLDGMVPVGSIRPWPSTDLSTLNRGGNVWLECNGQAVSIATYTALFALIGYSFGPDPGGGNFILPDMRARVPAGYDAGNSTGRLTGYREGVSANAVGNSGGEDAHVQASDELDGHTHGVRFRAENASVTLGGAEGFWRYVEFVDTDPAGGGRAANVTQPTIIMNWVIRAL